MSELKLNELNGQELFSDSENFLNELSEDELMEIIGGADMVTNSSIECALKSAVKSSAASVVYTVTKAAELSKNTIEQGTVLFKPDDPSGGPGSEFTEAGNYSFGDPGTF